MSSLRQRLLVLGGVIVASLLLLLPTLFPAQLGDSWPLSAPLSLGLDLRGGTHLVYEVQSQEAVTSRLMALGRSARSKLRSEKKVALLNLKDAHSDFCSDEFY